MAKVTLEEPKFAQPSSLAYQTHYVQKRRKKRKPSGTEEIEFITSNGLTITTANGEILIVQG